MDCLAAQDGQSDRFLIRRAGRGLDAGREAADSGGSQEAQRRWGSPRARTRRQDGGTVRTDSADWHQVPGTGTRHMTSQAIGRPSSGFPLPLPDMRRPFFLLIRVASREGAKAQKMAKRHALPSTHGEGADRNCALCSHARLDISGSEISKRFDHHARPYSRFPAIRKLRGFAPSREILPSSAVRFAASCNDPTFITTCRRN